MNWSIKLACAFILAEGAMAASLPAPGSGLPAWANRLAPGSSFSVRVPGSLGAAMVTPVVEGKGPENDGVLPLAPLRAGANAAADKSIRERRCE